MANDERRHIATCRASHHSQTREHLFRPSISCFAQRFLSYVDFYSETSLHILQVENSKFVVQSNANSKKSDTNSVKLLGQISTANVVDSLKSLSW